METNLQSISREKAMRNSSMVRMVPRAQVSTAPFTAQDRDAIVVQFFHLGFSVARLATIYGTGYGPIENVLAFGFWRAVGNRRADMAERGKAAA
jgi:hypothetical protein